MARITNTTRYDTGELKQLVADIYAGIRESEGVPSKSAFGTSIWGSFQVRFRPTVNKRVRTIKYGGEARRSFTLFLPPKPPVRRWLAHYIAWALLRYAYGYKSDSCNRMGRALSHKIDERPVGVPPVEAAVKMSVQEQRHKEADAALARAERKLVRLKAEAVAARARVKRAEVDTEAKRKKVAYYEKQAQKRMAAAPATLGDASFAARMRARRDAAE
jgi:hypothetical protein